MKNDTNLAIDAGPALNRMQEFAHRLALDIRSGRLPPGSRLPTEHQFAQATGVCRAVIREAIAALRAEGLVVTRQGLGAFVANDVERRPFRIDPDGLKTVADVLRVLELRMGIEIEAASLAAERRTNEDLAAIGAALRAGDEAVESGADAIDADFSFHFAIFRATGNDYFPEFLQFLGRCIVPRQRISVPGESDAQRRHYLRRIQNEHRRIYEAIAGGNMWAARRATRRHVANALERYRELGAREIGSGL